MTGFARTMLDTFFILSSGSRSYQNSIFLPKIIVTFVQLVQNDLVEQGLTLIKLLFILSIVLISVCATNIRKMPKSCPYFTLLFIKFVHYKLRCISLPNLHPWEKKISNFHLRAILGIRQCQQKSWKLCKVQSHFEVKLLFLGKI